MISGRTSEFVRRRRTLFGLLIVGALALSPLGGALAAPQVPTVSGLGTGAFAYTSPFAVIVVRPVNGVLKQLEVQTSSCVAVVKLGALEFKTNADLTSAKVLKKTPCGFVSMNWTGMGGLKVVVAGVVRWAKATGSVGGVHVASIGNKDADIFLGAG